jgi:hypothetical protein
MLIKFSRLIAVTAFLILFSGIFFERNAIAEEKTDPSDETIDISLGLGLVTKHVNPGNDTNEDSDFIALSIDKYSVARFINSYNDETWVWGMNFHTSKWNIYQDSDFFLRGNLYAGLMSGYKDHLPNLCGITPVVLPTFDLGYKRVSLEFMYFPSPAGGVFSSVLRFDLSWPKSWWPTRALQSDKPDTSPPNY